MVNEYLLKILEKSLIHFLNRLSKKWGFFDAKLVNTTVEPKKYSDIVIFKIEFIQYEYFNGRISEIIDDLYKFRPLGEGIFKAANETEPIIHFTIDANQDNIGKERIQESQYKSNEKLKLKINCGEEIEEEKKKIIFDFIHFLNDNLTLHKKVLIDLIDQKAKKMTTGVRMPYHHIKVLCKDRMLVDILRTLAHEWTHEYQHQEMGVPEKAKRLQIGGWSENHANAMAGILLKKYVFKHKKLENILY